ncbi:helicase-related protein [Rufibacter soli]
MNDFEEFIKVAVNDINTKGFCRRKFSSLLWSQWGYKRKKKAFLNGLDQALLENDILAYTKVDNIKRGKPNWSWADLSNNDSYITFVYNSNLILKNPPRGVLFKMNVVNEPTPTEKLFTQYASKATEILICSAYVDEYMASLLADIAKVNNIKVRFVADINFNSNPYRRGIIRSKIETVGTFRTLAGVNNEDGIMHLKLYVFYLGDGEVSIFNTSANFTAAAWRYTNSESPVTIQTGRTDNTQISIMVNAAENIWNKSENVDNSNMLKQGDKVSHPGFGIGEIFKVTGDAAQVVFTGGNFQTVKCSDLNMVVDPLQMIEEGSSGERDTIHRTKAKFLAHYLYAQNSLTNEFYDFRIKPVPHQLLALKKSITSPNGGNLLFADDVGLGKTIEAGLVIQNTIRRIGEDKARVLIMCPAGLKWQWYEEMKDKFGLSFEVWKWHTTGGAEAFSGSFHGKNRMIASYHGMVVGDTEEAILRMMEAYDLVVIDECHKFSNDATQWWKLTRDMRANHKVGQLLLLSATPHSGDRSRFLNLLHLLDKEEFPKGTDTQESLKKVASQAIIQNYVYRNDKLSVTDFDSKPLFKNVTTKSIDVELTVEEQHFCELVVDYIRALDEAKKKLSGKIQTQVGFVISVYRKMLASSWKNVFRSMQARYKYLLNQALEEEGYEPLFDADEEIDEKEERDIANLMKEMKSSKIVKNEIEFLEKIVNFGKELEKKNVDTKIQKLIEVINAPEFTGQKFIIFTQYVKTLEIIKKALGGKDYVAEIQGSINVEDRKGQVDKFRTKVRYMVCTEAGGEGINLQFANNVINFDMPWNPARLQQRIGRVWRYGQEQEVNCFNFFVTNSISDQRVLESLNQRINEMVRNFLVQLEFNGIKEELHDALIYDTTIRVLGKAQEEESFESIMGILDDTLRDHRLVAAENRIKAALSFVQLEQKDLAPSVGIPLEEISSFYAPRSINFLKQFADSIARAFGGCLKEHGNQVFEFINMDLTEARLPNTLFENKKYVFEQGKAGKNEGDRIYFFGFGDDFFTHMVEISRNQSFGGLVGYASVKLPFSSTTNAIAIASSAATSVVVNNERSENYSVCSFISVSDGTEISPEHLFGEEWFETEKAQKLVDKSIIEQSMTHVFDNHKQKLKAYRHKEFILTSPTIESALALSN